MNNPKSSNKSFHSNITVVIGLYQVIYLYAVWKKKCYVIFSNIDGCFKELSTILTDIKLYFTVLEKFQ